MADESPQAVSIPIQTVQSVNPKQNILDQTLGDVLKNNSQAQQVITTSMGITHENFQQMLNSAQQNNLMHMKIGDLFENGIVQQAVQQGTSGPVQIVQQQPISQKTSLLDKVRKWLR